MLSKVGRPNTGSVKTKSRVGKNGKKKVFKLAVFRFIGENGKPAEKSKIVKDKTEGKDWIKDQQKLVKDNGVKAIRFQDTTFKEFSEKFAETNIVELERTSCGKRYTGRKSYKPAKSQLASLQKFFGKKRVIDIEYRDLKRYVNHRLETPILLKDNSEKFRSPSTVKRELALLSKMFNSLKREGKIAVTPFERGDALLPSAEIENERLRVLSFEEQEKLFAACDVVIFGKHRRHIKPILTFAIETGMRRSEIRSLAWSDVDLEARIIHVKQQNTKTERSRDVPIHPEKLLPLLLEMKGNAKPSDLVFGRLPKSIKKPFETACRIAEIEDLHFHDLRATFITRAIERRVPSEIVRKVSGHMTDKAFQRYLRFSKQSLNEAFFG